MPIMETPPPFSRCRPKIARQTCGRAGWKRYPGPDIYGGLYRGEDAVARYASHLDQAIAKLAERGEGTASVIFDNIFSSEGVFPPPPGYLQAAYAKVRAAGGLCIADEVQSGFGRTGDHMWGFSHDGVIPGYRHPGQTHG